MIERGKSIIGICGALAVAFGAFGAHALKSILDVSGIQSFQTGVLYHFIHTLAMAFCYVLWTHTQSKAIGIAFNLFLAGIMLFSGSLYGMAFGKAAGINLTFLGPITPLGGVSFIIGWLMLVKK